jgi:hypothetical protein
MTVLAFEFIAREIKSQLNSEPSVPKNFNARFLSKVISSAVCMLSFPGLVCNQSKDVSLS